MSKLLGVHFWKLLFSRAPRNVYWKVITELMQAVTTASPLYPFIRVLYHMPEVSVFRGGAQIAVLSFEVSLCVPIIIGLLARVALPAHSLPICLAPSSRKGDGVDGPGILSANLADSL